MKHNDTEVATSYQYKIAWLFPVAPDLFDNYKEERIKLFAIIRALNITSFTSVNFKDSEGKCIDTLLFNKTFNKENGNQMATKHIQKELRKNPNVYYVELIRK